MVVAKNKVEYFKKEDIYRILFESAGEGLLVANRAGDILMANPRVYEMFGYNKNELIGKSIEILVPDRFRHNHKKHRETYHKKPKKRSMGSGMDLQGKRKNGTTFPVEISLNYFRQGDDLLVMALLTDISERKALDQKLLHLNNELEMRVEERTEALRESQKLYNAIARNYPNGTISVFDDNLRYVFVEGKELFKIGITGEKLIGTKYIERLPKDIAPTVEKQLTGVLKGVSATLELEYRNNHYVLNAVPLTDSKGKISQILVVEQNITEQKKAEKEIRRALQKEKELNELKSRFVSMASHEFRTPLSTILSSVSLAEKYVAPEDSEKREKHFNRIKSSVRNLTSILNDFLSLDKLEAGKVENNPVEFDLKEFATELAEEMQAVAKTGQRVNYKHTGKQTIVNLDRNILKNILNNLLSNAIKYSPEHSEIFFNSIIEKNKLKINIADKGIGIPEEEKQHLFERFFRAKNALNIGGTGLGLNIVKKYTDLLGGEIGFESECGKGTVFTVSIPQ